MCVSEEEEKEKEVVDCLCAIVAVAPITAERRWIERTAFTVSATVPVCVC